MNHGSLRIRDATRADSAAITAIYQPYVTGTVVSFEVEPPGIEEMAGRIETTQRNHAWLVAECDGTILGYACGTPHRQRAAYRYSVETSVYVNNENHRQGIGRRLYDALFQRLAELNYFNAYAGITLPNEASVAFHQAAGFRPLGVFKSVGFKFDAWRDVAWLHRSLKDGKPSGAAG